MSDKILVDTSAWILSFRRTGSLKLKEFLIEALDLDRVATSNIIVLELLQGAKTEKEYYLLKSRLDVLALYGISESTWNMAYKAGFQLRRKGITVPTADILISCIAKEHGLHLLHHDAHLKAAARELGVKAVDYLE